MSKTQQTAKKVTESRLFAEMYALALKDSEEGICLIDTVKTLNIKLDTCIECKKQLAELSEQHNISIKGLINIIVANVTYHTGKHNMQRANNRSRFAGDRY